MSEVSDSIPTPRPSVLGALTRGGLSGLVSGVVMAGIMFALNPLIMGAAFTFTAASLLVAASATFGGLMGAKRAMFDVPSAAHGNTASPDMVPVPVMTAGVAPAMVPTLAMADEAYDQTPTKNWSASVGRGDDSKNRIEQILQNGAMGDKDRAAAILASRESADQQNFR